MRPVPHLLTLPAELAVRLLVLELLDDTVEAREQLDDPAETDALHDFRVALRRLRSGLRTYRPQLERSVPKRLRRRLVRIARAAGDSRDVEVHLQWLRAQLADLGPNEETSAQPILAWLEARKARADRKLRDRLERSFTRTVARLDQRLRDYGVRLDPYQISQDTAGRLIGGQLQMLADDLEQALIAAGSFDEIESAHAARIAAKRLRYTLDPIESLVDGIPPLLDQLKALQDLLGELRDSQIFLQDLEGTADPTDPALTWLYNQLRQRSAAAAAHLHQDWLGTAPAPMLQQAREIGVSVSSM